MDLAAKWTSKDENDNDFFFYDDQDAHAAELEQRYTGPSSPTHPHPAVAGGGAPVPDGPIQRIMSRQLDHCRSEPSFQTADQCQWWISTGCDAANPTSTSMSFRTAATTSRCSCCHQLVTLKAKTDSPRVIARSFQDVAGDVWAVALGGFRVRNGHHVLGRGHHRVEFEVILSTEDTHLHAWRTFEDFERLAWQVGVQRSANSPVSALAKAGRRWEQVRYHHRRFFDQFNLPHLIQQFHRLTAFLEHTVFSLDTPEQLMAFVDTSKWDGDRWFKSPPVCGKCEL